MIGKIISGPDGNPIDSLGNKLSPSSYQPSKDVSDLFACVQKDYQTAWALHHRSFDEFDGISLLQRENLDQQTFAAFVGAEYVPQHKQWRWRGRKNTARNKLIGILAHMLSGILFPFVTAVNERDEEDKLTAEIMRIRVEDHLRHAQYDTKFLYFVLSALVNPAIIVQVEYVEAMQRIKQKMADGSIQIREAVDTILSGLQLNIVPVDEFLIADFYTNQVQQQPYIIRVRRIAWDTAREVYGKNPNFKYVEAGKTRVVMAGQENQTLFDVEWTEADRNYVQEITAYYRTEDLEVTFVGGVFIGNEDDIYNNNPFKHRRLSLIENEWVSIPVYEYAKAYFEPIDPTGRFFYGKSGAFKEYWDDKSQNTLAADIIDGTHLDVWKPMFLSGVSNMNSTVIAPAAVISMPSGASATPYSLGPNLAAAYKAIQIQTDDMSESTQDRIMGGQVDPNVTAYATSKAEQNARIFLGVFGVMVADLVRQIGELVMDVVVQFDTVGVVDATVPEALRTKYKTYVSQGKEKGKQVTHRVIFTDKNMAKEMTKKQIHDHEWALYDQAGGHKSEQRIHEVNPYLFARTSFGCKVDADKIIDRSMGNERQQNMLAFQMMTDPRAAPYINQEAVVDDFVIEEFADGDPDRYKKIAPSPMLNAVMGGQQGVQPGQPPQPMPQGALPGQLPVAQ